MLNTRNRAGTTANVSFMREDVRNALPSWERIRDCLDGEDAIKRKRTVYLPIPDVETGGTATSARYISYLSRAVFYNVTGRTMLGLLGQVFGRESDIKLPEHLSTLVDDIDGTGIGIEQQAKRSLQYCLGYGRGGLLADFPVVNGVVTKQQTDSQEIRPIIKLYRPEQIINWRTTKRGSRTLLSLVVLKEVMDVSDDGFETETTEIYRVLRLEEQGYTVELFAEDRSSSQIEIIPIGEKVAVLDAAGQPFTEIPFVIFGPENNDPDVDSSPLDSMAALNIAHYRNSADYEDSVFLIGQPTPVFTGLTEEWVRTVLGGRVHLGSRTGIMLPKDATAELLQASPNTMAKEAMEMKEGQMRALGAKLVEDRSIRRTATEATQDEASETSVLGSATKNVSAAYTAAIKWCMKFTRQGVVDFTFSLNTDFDLSTLTPQQRQQLIAEWQAEAISFTEMRHNLKRGRVAFQDNEIAMAEISENPPPSAVAAQNALDLAQADAQDNNNNA